MEAFGMIVACFVLQVKLSWQAQFLKSIMEGCDVCGICRKAMIARSAEARVGPAWLYCGCRRREEDFLYGDELQAFVDDGTLTRLEVAFSREGPSKVYVQHLIAKQV